MDYKDINNKQAFDKFKIGVLANLSNYINDLETNDYKKSVILTYWLKDYTNYLKNESKFNPIYIPKFKRGSIVEINMGFNIGSEYGGVHYGIVLNKKDTKENPNLTIIPMSSKNTNIHKTEVDLGNEFYNIVNQKIKLLSTQCDNYIADLESKLKILDMKDFNSLEDYNSFVNEIESKISLTHIKVKELNKCRNKIIHLKQGGIALISQITTISKMRVKDPLNQKEPLYDIQLSNKTMEQIDKKITQLFIKEY
ncbi:MAG: type II toxin-antitoxin system PemK/MazF family toxin [Peptoanaerobacter stomatis]|uniref:type II toxin-antitoxin system PemK/MazF family toxin n=1 Tax=Peptoanaerobacter stomatis TaxID=796937 RepID=UPI003FA00DCF